MGRWDHTINVTTEWEIAEEIGALGGKAWINLRDRIVTKFQPLKEAFPEDWELEETLDELGEAGDVDDFDAIMQHLYDWCDNHRVWIETILPEPAEVN